MAESVPNYDGSPIQIEMLGGFNITMGEVTISDSSARTHQVWSLLEYLIAYRHKTISNEELIRVLWSENDSEQPANALKNLVYRIRTLFANNNVPFAKNVIVYEHGCYSWNEGLNCTVDAEEFERLYGEASNKNLTEEERLRIYLEALDLYKGDFLSSSHFEEWVVPLSTYFHALYFKCVQESCQLLQKRGDYQSIETIAQKAIIIDQFEERAHITLIDAMIHQGKQQQALSHYNYVTDLFYRELGDSPSEPLRNLYREISKTVNSVETDLQVIKEDLNESNLVKGAYYCEYEVFKNMYRVEARSAARTGQSIFIGLLTVTDMHDGVPEIKLLGKTMKQLLETIRNSLRKGDIVSRFSATQYVLMLPTVTFENGSMVLDRIVKRFRAEHPSTLVKLHSKLLPLDPIM